MKHAVVLFIVVCCSLSSAGAQETGDQILALMDQATTRAHDQYFVFDLVTHRPGAEPRTLQFSVHLMGTKFRRLEFLAPGDVKGMRILVRDVDKMYVYMPAYAKVRRVASHVRSQGFMGSAYSQDEMTIVTYADVYAAKLVTQTDEEWGVELTRRPNQSFPYPLLKMRIRKDNHHPSRIQYYDDQRNLVKTEERVNYECKKELCNPRVMTMIDHTRKDIRSVLTRIVWKPNNQLDERFFSVRALQRRR